MDPATHRFQASEFASARRTERRAAVSEAARAVVVIKRAAAAWVRGALGAGRPRTGDAIDAATRQAAQQHHTLAASMFRKFTKEDHIKSASAVRSSDQRSIRALILEQYPALEPFIEDIFPKKDSLIVCKCQNYLQVLLDPKGEFIFFQCRQGPYIPTLRFLHKCTPRAAAF